MSGVGLTSEGMQEESKDDSAVEDQVRGLGALDLLSNAAAESAPEPPAQPPCPELPQERSATKREPVSDLFPVHLFVAAVGNGKIDEGTPAKTREVLEQVCVGEREAGACRGRSLHARGG